MIKINKAFTLVELIVVITILAILWTIAFISLQWYSRDARDSIRKSDIASIEKALGLFYTKRWFYPEPSFWVDITYSWWTVWNQWTVWDSVINNLEELSKKPVDPLTLTEYAYSRLNTKKEFEVWWVLEWWIINKIIPVNHANAQSTKIWTAYIKWDYNWVLAKVNTWSTTYVLWVPTIISWDISLTDIIQLQQNNKLSFHWTNNLPASYRNSDFNVDWWWFVFNPWTIVAYEWTAASLELESNQISLFQWLQTVFTWSDATKSEAISKIVNADSSTDEWKLLANLIIKNNINSSIKEYTSWPSLTWWRALDPNCDIPDIVIWTQTWAWCNSTLWDWFEWGKLDNWSDSTITSCYPNYDWINSTWSCNPWNPLHASNAKANNWFSWANWNWDSEFNTIWWKLYLWQEAIDTACPAWWHIPNNSEWETLETELNSSVNCRSNTSWWRCDWLWWNWHNLKNETNNLVNALKIPLAWRRNTFPEDFIWRGSDTQLWSSTPSGNAYTWLLDVNNSTVARNIASKFFGFSVRCIKD